MNNRIEEINAKIEKLEESKEEAQIKADEFAVLMDEFDKSEHLSHDEYDDMLDEVYGDCNIAGMSYSTSKALKDVDTVAYNVGFNDWVDGYEIENIAEYQELKDEHEEAEREVESIESQIIDLEDEREEIEDSKDEE